MKLKTEWLCGRCNSLNIGVRELEGSVIFSEKEPTCFTSTCINCDEESVVEVFVNSYLNEVKS